VEGRRAVVTPEHHALEALGQARGARSLQVPFGPLALPDGTLVPLDPEPAKVVEDPVLTAREIPRRVGVVDPQEQVLSEAAIRHGAERIADVQRSGRARCEANAGHTANATRFRGISRASPAPTIATAALTQKAATNADSAGMCV